LAVGAVVDVGEGDFLGFVVEDGRVVGRGVELVPVGLGVEVVVDDGVGIGLADGVTSGAS
jgi:hypothetical protein